MKACLLGRPGSGRETVFRALTGLGALPAHQDLRLGEARVADPRLDYLSSVFKPRKHTPARLDLALPKPLAEPHKALKASLERARDADVLLLVAADFPDASGAAPDPAAQAAEICAELVGTDFVALSSRLERMDEDHRRGRKADPVERALLVKALELLENDKPLRLDPDLAKDPGLRGYGLLSSKPALVLLNGPDEGGAPAPQDLGVPALAIRGNLEMELRALEPDEALELMGSYGLSEPGVDRVSKTLYDLMGLISFFTVGEDECRAWTVSKGDNALTAAGQVHSDIQRGFIRAEVVAYEDFRSAGSFAEAKKKGQFRLEGKTYPVVDGDIVHFRFNV
ncbi:MAG: DUF933 domain-containing protein [Deltaproteobacteria bacterium]|jgi:ribosome-binding ATPase YchF (GTP1/OBG family)|nr:DUF933 domain-containing protein [Deltaproteobacteria bacterium]